MNDNIEMIQKPFSITGLIQAFGFAGLYLLLGYFSAVIAQDREAESVDLIELQDQLIKEKAVEPEMAPREPLGISQKTETEKQLESKNKARTRNEKNRKKRIKERLKKN